MSDRAATVLLAVEQEEESRALALLREAGFEVVTAKGGEPATLIGSRSVDVVVASVPDCAEPVQLVAEALRRDPGIEIIIATGRADFDEALACLRAGAADLLALPIEGGALESAVIRAVERRRARGLARELLGVARATCIGQLTGSIAHEIANPVAILTSSLDGIADSLATLAELRALLPQGHAPTLAWWERAGREALAQAGEVMAEAQEGAQRLKALARDLRAMAGGDPSAVSDLDVADAVEAALRVGRAELTGRVKVSLEIPPGLGVHANRGAFTQALVQLLVRAAQAAHDAGHRHGNVRVRAREQDGSITIEVEDDVAPAKPEAAARLFAPYLPVGTSSGVGALGLAVARELVERQGGSLTARSAKAGGTVFEVKLRAAVRARPAASG